MKTIAIGADHGGVLLKDRIIEQLKKNHPDYQVINFGTDNTDSIDYSDFANRVAIAISSGTADYGILVCRTGIGMALTANKYNGVRALASADSNLITRAKEHNNINALCLGQDITTPDIDISALLRSFLTTSFTGGRHQQRIDKQQGSFLIEQDPVLYAAMYGEQQRQETHIELIASENFTSAAIREIQGSYLTNKYAEGYPGKRWYGGCEQVDKIEQLAIDRAKQLFGADHANVQPHSGSQANAAVYYAVLQHGDTILTMDLAHGGHLTHGHPANFSGKFYNVHHYGVSATDYRINYEALAEQAMQVKPKLITTGASAYSREIDFAKIAAIAKQCGAYLFVDMAHIAGLVAAKLHPSPIPHADFVTSTTHKSLRGPRGGLILCTQEHAKKIDSMVFPGTQGGPLMHVIGGKAACFYEALQPEFTAYSQQVIRNAQAMANEFIKRGYHVLSDGTDNHLLLINLTNKQTNGATVQALLDSICITVNKNAIPFDTASPFKPSGIRIGTPAVTTRGMQEQDCRQVVVFIDRAIQAADDEKLLTELKAEVLAFNRQFPLQKAGL